MMRIGEYSMFALHQGGLNLVQAGLGVYSARGLGLGLRTEIQEES